MNHQEATYFQRLDKEEFAIEVNTTSTIGFEIQRGDVKSMILWKNLLKVTIDKGEKETYIFGFHYCDLQLASYFGLVPSKRVCKSISIRMCSNTSNHKLMLSWLEFIWKQHARQCSAVSSGLYNPICLCLGIGTSASDEMASIVRTVTTVCDNHLQKSRKAGVASSTDVGQGKGSFTSTDGYCCIGGAKLLVFVNPFSGSGGAYQAYRRSVLPLFDHAGVDATVIETEMSGHALRYMRDMSATSVDLLDGVAIMGGDGLIWEVLNGIMSRNESKKTDLTRLEVLRRLPLGILPGGTGNGLAKSVLYQSKEDYGLTQAAFVVAKGLRRPLDIACVDTPIRRQERSDKEYEIVDQRYPSPGKGGRLFSALSLSWAMIADVDIESEMYRCCGSFRFTFGGLIRMFRLRTYSGKLQYRVPHFSSKKSSGKKLKHSLPDLSKPLKRDKKKEEWRVIEGDFQLFWACNTSWAAHDCHQTPNTELNGGIWKILIVKKMSKFDFLKLFTGALEEGTHIHHPDAVVVETDAFRLEPEPLEGTNEEGGHLSLDGERVPYGKVQVEIFGSKANVFCL
eukprot:g3897.t1